MRYQDLFAALHEPAPVVDAPLVVRPRPYQSDACESVLRMWASGTRSVLVTLPTGCGKTVVFTEIMRRHETGGRILVLAHREELIYQAAAHARRAGLDVGIEMGSQRAGRADVVISTVQTQVSVSRCRSCMGDGCVVCDHNGNVRRMTSFDPCDFDLVIVDEAHHATAKTYRMILHWYMRNPQCRALLVTATPKRSDDIGLHNVCDDVAYEMDLRTAIADGWLCPIRQRYVVVHGLNLARVSTKAGGDLADGELERAFLGDTTEGEQRLLHAVARPTIDEAAGRQGIVFCAGQAHAVKLTAAFNAYDGVNAALVLGNTPRDERRRIVSDFRERRIQFLVGCGVFTEGFDAPDAAIIAVARPTKSASLYLQMIGRGTRPLPGLVDGVETAADRQAAIAASAKPICTVIDFVGNTGRHKLVGVANVLAGEDVHPEDLDQAIRAARRAQKTVDVAELIERAKQAREARERRAERKRREITTHRAERVDYNSIDVDLFAGVEFADEGNERISPLLATPKQVRLLTRLGVGERTARTFTRRQASKVIDKLRNQTGGDFILEFGKYAGRRLRDVPLPYRVWLRENIQSPRIQAALEEFDAVAEQRT